MSRRNTQIDVWTVMFFLGRRVFKSNWDAPKIKLTDNMRTTIHPNEFQFVIENYCRSASFFVDINIQSDENGGLITCKVCKLSVLSMWIHSSRISIITGNRKTHQWQWWLKYFIELWWEWVADCISTSQSHSICCWVHDSTLRQQDIDGW